LISQTVIDFYTLPLLPTVAKFTKLGWKRVCECGANVDRDLNEARGIFLRVLAVTPWLG